jgi:hypothetical protein
MIISNNIMVKVKRMKKYRIEHKPPKHKTNNIEDMDLDELIEHCVKKGLIEKTEYGYYFKPEFFETLEIYDE